MKILHPAKKPKTRGDILREMDDEAMAISRTRRIRAGYVMAIDIGTFTSLETAYEAELAWLRQEATT